MWPDVSTPVVDGGLRPFGRLRVGNLLRESEFVQQLRDVLHAVFDTESVGDDLGDSLRVPAFVRPSGSNGSGLDDLFEFVELFRCKMGYPSGISLACESGNAPVGDFLFPTFDAGEGSSGDLDDFVEVVSVFEQLPALQTANRLQGDTSLFGTHGM